MSPVGLNLHVDLPQPVLDRLQAALTAAWWDGATTGFSVGLLAGCLLLVLCLMIRGRP